MTRAHLTHTGADFEHFSGNLMTEHQGFANFKVQDSAFGVIMQVRSADSSSTEAYQDFAVLRVRRLSAILNFELFGSVDDTRDHRGVGRFPGSVSERVSMTQRFFAIWSAM